jgi:hypothetical protein
MEGSRHFSSIEATEAFIFKSINIPDEKVKSFRKIVRDFCNVLREIPPEFADRESITLDGGRQHSTSKAASTLTS